MNIRAIGHGMQGRQTARKIQNIKIESQIQKPENNYQTTLEEISKKYNIPIWAIMETLNGR